MRRLSRLCVGPQTRGSGRESFCAPMVDTPGATIATSESSAPVAATSSASMLMIFSILDTSKRFLSAGTP